MGDLFRRLRKWDWFHFGNVPERALMKSDDEHYIGPEGRHHINPLTLIFPSNGKIKPTQSVYDPKNVFDLPKGDSNGQPTDKDNQD